MAITSNGLKQLGYTPEVDFTLQDDSNGNGVYIKSWISLDAQPTVSAIEAAEVEWQTAYDAQEYARKRALEYPSVQDFMEAYTEKEIGEDSTKWDSYKTKYNKVRTENPK